MAMIYVTVDGHEGVEKLISSFEELGLAEGALAIALHVMRGDVCDAMVRVFEAANVAYHVAYQDGEMTLAASRGRVCSKCGAAFEPKRSGQKRCGNCSAAPKKAKVEDLATANQRMRQCPYCNEWFTPKIGFQKVCGKMECLKLRDRDSRAMRKKQGNLEEVPEVEEDFDKMFDVNLRIEADANGVARYQLWNGVELSEYQMTELLRSRQLTIGALVRDLVNGWVIVNGSYELRRTQLTGDFAQHANRAKASIEQAALSDES